MAEKKEDFSKISYVFGIMSIVFAFFTPLAGLILGIIGFVQSKKQKTNLSKKAKKLNTIGIILSAILFIITIAVTLYFTIKGVNSFPSFPLK